MNNSIILNLLKKMNLANAHYYTVYFNQVWTIIRAPAHYWKLELCWIATAIVVDYDLKANLIASS